jgi:hypothetical protein
VSGAPGSCDRRAVAACIAAAAVVHAHVLGASFATDDFPHLFNADALPLGTFSRRSTAATSWRRTS